jgi:hypothetical protein
MSNKSWHRGIPVDHRPYDYFALGGTAPPAPKRFCRRNCVEDYMIDTLMISQQNFHERVALHKGRIKARINGILREIILHEDRLHV